MRVWLVATLLASSLLAGTLAAKEGWQSSVPNSSAVSGLASTCQVCHISTTGPSLNSFGDQVRRYLKNGIPDWAVLANLDADRDGATNGQELQDPTGKWKQGDPAPGFQSRVSNPSVGSSTPSSVKSTTDTWAHIKALFR